MPSTEHEVLLGPADEPLEVMAWLDTDHAGNAWDGVSYRGVVVKIKGRSVQGYAHFLSGAMRFRRTRQ